MSWVDRSPFCRVELLVVFLNHQWSMALAKIRHAWIGESPGSLPSTWMELCKHVVHVTPCYKCVHKTIAFPRSNIVVSETEPPEFRQMSRQPKISLKMSASDSSRLLWVSFKHNSVFDSK